MKLRTVALLARKPGLSILDRLIHHPDIDLRSVWTHRYLPKAEWQNKNVCEPRPEFITYDQWCRVHGIDLVAHPYEDLPPSHGPLPESEDFHIRKSEPVDLLLSFNWRRLVNKTLLEKCRYAINIHRGELPKYPGARPVKQAIEAGEKQVAITAHWMTEDFDEGRPLAKVYAPVRPNPISSEDATRASLEPYYVPLLNIVIEQIRALEGTDSEKLRLMSPKDLQAHGCPVRAA